MYSQEYPREPEWAGGLTPREVRDFQEDGVVSIAEPGEGERAGGLTPREVRDLQEDGVVSIAEPGEGERGLRPGGYGLTGYGPECYGPERFGRPGYVGGYGEGYGREGYGQGYGREGYGQYPSETMYVQRPPVEYVGPESSDLGMGVRDSHVVSSTDYSAGYGRPEVGGIEYGDGETLRLREEMQHERRRNYEAELAAGAAMGYGLYERHQRNDAEEYGYRPERHHLF